MSTATMICKSRGYIQTIKFSGDPSMSSNKDDTIELHADTTAMEPKKSGWDPYIFSMFKKADQPYPEERRRKPRTRDASRRRALLLAQSRRGK